MENVYVRFGEIENPKFTRVYEAILKGDEVQIIMPKASHSGARDVLEDIGFGDVKTFIVTGVPVDRDDRDRLYLKNTKVDRLLKYDGEKFLIDKGSFLDEITDETPFKTRMSLLKKELKKLWSEAKMEMKKKPEKTGEPMKDFFKSH